MYVAVVLTPASRSQLISLFEFEITSLMTRGFKMKNIQGDDLIHHATLHLGEAKESDRLGSKIIFEVSSFAFDSNVAAFGITHTNSSFGTPIVVSDNVQPHITALISETGKPFMSNNLTNWQSCPKIIVEGFVEQC